MQLCINSYKEYRLYALLVHYEVVALMVHLHLYIICLIYLANQHVFFFLFQTFWVHEQDSENEYHPSPDDMDSELESENKFQATAFAKDQKTVKHP